MDSTLIDYDEFRKNETSINYYFDYLKDDKDITINDLRCVAEAHAGKLISESYSGNIYEPLEWENQDKERFIMKPYSILRCGHWMNISYKEYAWDFDRLAKTDKIYAQIWYDHHDQDEDNFYYYDDNFQACYRKL